MLSIRHGHRRPRTTSPRRRGAAGRPRGVTAPGLAAAIALAGFGPAGLGAADAAGATRDAAAGRATAAIAPSAPSATGAVVAGPAALPEVGAAAVAAVVAAEWVAVFDVPDRDALAARRPLPNASAARVALRSRGRIVSDVTTVADPLDTTAPAGDERRATLLRRAVGASMAAALSDRTVATAREALGDDFGGRLTLELELAGPLVPLPGRTLEEIAGQVRPGLDGLALRRGDEVALFFPGRMIAEGVASDLARVLPALASELGLPFIPYQTLRERFDARLYRFESLHFVQARPGATPEPRTRGLEPVVAAAMQPITITSAGRDLFTHVVSRFWATDAPLGMRGGYDAALDVYRPAVAPGREQALVAFALARWAASPGLRPDDRERPRAAAAVLLEELRLVAAGERPPLEDPVTSAAIVLAEAEIAAGGRDSATGLRAPRPDNAPVAAPVDPDAPPVAAADSRAALRGRAAEDVTVLVATLAATAGTDDVVSLLDPHDRAVLLAAATRHALAPGPVAANTIDEVRRALDATWDSVPAGEQVSMMPWLAWAETWHAERTGGPLPPTVRERLRTLRIALEAFQIDAAWPGVAVDLHGGFALASGPMPLAGAQSTRPAVLLGWMLAEPALTDPDEVAAHREPVRLACRFLRQITLRRGDQWSTRGASRAIGGLRGAPWDPRMPLPAQAMGLLAYAEALRGLDRPVD